MKKKFLQLGRELLNQEINRLNQWIALKKIQTQQLIKDYGWKALMAVFVGMLLSQKDIQVQIGKDHKQIASIATYAVVPAKSTTTESFSILETKSFSDVEQMSFFKETPPKSTATILNQLPETNTGFWSKKGNSNASTALQTKWKDDGTLANTYSNLTYNIDKKNLTPKQQKKCKKQIAYIKRFVKIAQTEMEKFGVPVSITLAQGLLESNVGESRLSTRNNNHFGMKCFSKSCKKGHCSNFTDDSHKDFFRKYPSAWESYRAHSKMLGGKRYRHLKKLNRKDYKNWAKGLKKAGYATDKRYAEKLINLIEELELFRFDK